MQKAKQFVGTLINWGLPGSGAGISVHFFLSHQWTEATLSSLVTLIVALGTIGKKFVKKVLERIEKRVIDDAEPLADLIYDVSKEAVIRLWWKFTSPFQGKYYQSLIYACRDYRTQGLKTKGPFTLDLEKVFVPLRVSPESAARISAEIIRGGGSAQGLSIWDFLAASLTQPAYCSIAIIGAPGSGKSTLLEHLTLTYAQNAQRRKHRRAPKLMPILLYLRDVREKIAQSQLNLPDLIEQQDAIRKLNPPPRWFEDQLRHQPCLVMLDGLDEVADETQRQVVSRWVNQQIQAYPKARFLLTSRPFGYRSAPVSAVGTVLEVRPFNLTQMQTFIQNWYLQREIMSRLGKDDPGIRQIASDQANDLIERIRNSSPLAAMALNPLLLTMIATVHCYRGALPGQRVELYAEICDVLLGRRQDAKGISDPLNVTQKLSLLQVLALGLMQQQTREFTLELGSAIIQDKLATVTRNTTQPAEFLQQIEQLSGLLVEREKGVYEFAHKSFQEYLAAVQVKETNQEPLLTQHISDAWWDETIRLYAAKSDATNLIRAALQNPTVVSLRLAYDCAEEGLSVETEVWEQLKDRLETGLESADPEIAKLAVEVKLARRLSQMLRIDEQVEIDLSYITEVEYQLFLDEQLRAHPDAIPHRFQPGKARNPINGISFEHALGFCAWLSSRAQSQVREEDDQGIYYRLPTTAEVHNHPPQEYLQLDCWTMEGDGLNGKGLRVAKAQLPAQYTKLLIDLIAGDWQKADQDTVSVMCRAVNPGGIERLDVGAVPSLPCTCLHRLDQLWMQYSQGRFGLGLQTTVWESLGGSPLRDCLPHRWWSDAAGDDGAIFAALAQRFIDCGIERCGIERSLPRFEFDLVVVNPQGQEIQREHHQTGYFTEDLGADVSLEMVAIPGGSFQMGSQESKSEQPQHLVTIQPFFMGKYPVTQAQWRAVATLPKINVELKSHPSMFKGLNRPVEQVSWYDAVEFCARLSKQTGRLYCLPSEAEWEYACRAGTTTPFQFGPTITTELANYNGDYTYGKGPKGVYRKKTTEVGEFKAANAFGLYDMHGNVWEWCADHWHKTYRVAPTDGSDWITGGDKKYRLLRGGSWKNGPGYCRSAIRNWGNPDFRFNVVGLRVVCRSARTS